MLHITRVHLSHGRSPVEPLISKLQFPPHAFLETYARDMLAKIYFLSTKYPYTVKDHPHVRKDEIVKSLVKLVHMNI